jgi:hypothetical protein
MPLNGYTMGLDVSVDINADSGPLRLSVVTKFTADPVIGGLSVTPLNGQKDELEYPNGWKGTISLERKDSTADDYQAKWEDDYFNGVVRAAATITETINETDGSTSTYRYTNVYLHLSKGGDKAGDKTVQQEFTWTARRRLKVA